MSIVKQIKEWGFDGIEFPIAPMTSEVIRSFARQCDDLDLGRTTILALDAAAADPASSDPKLRKAAAEEIKRVVDQTREIGADLLCGPLFQGLGRFSGKSPTADEWRWAADTLREAAEYAAALGIRIALEPINRFEMYMVNTVAGGAAFVKQVGLPNVGLLVDTHHGNIEESNTARAWESVSDHIFHVHLSENHRGIPGSGHAISDDIFDLLKRIDYKGWVTIEAFGLAVPGLISRLHLWRNLSSHNDDAAVQQDNIKGGDPRMAIIMGCQTYTWQMSYEKYADKLSHILEVVEQAGFQGVEAEVCMMGNFYHSPALFTEELQKRNLQLAGLTLALPWKHAKETEDERQEAEQLLDYLKHFPKARLNLVQQAGKDRYELTERQRNCLSCLNAVAERAYERGIISAFHPNSSAGSVFRTEEDYKWMFDGLDTRFVGYCPDSGHIANGGMNVNEVFKASRSIIRHVHFKDITADGQWTVMGKGIIDHPSIVKMLKDTGYEGWIMVEEESIRAKSEPDEVTMENGRYVRQSL